MISMVPSIPLTGIRSNAVVTDQESYNIANWLVYNRDVLMLDAPKTGDAADIKNFVIYKVIEHFRHVPLDHVYAAFEDERVLIVFDFYYIKNGKGVVQ